MNGIFTGKKSKRSESKRSKSSRKEKKAEDSYSGFGSDHYSGFGSNYGKYGRSQSDKYSDFSSSYSTSNDGYSSEKYKMFIRKVYSDMKDDFIRANYIDKFILDDPNVIIGYTFENGRTIKLKHDGRLEDVTRGNGKRVKIEYSDMSNLMAFYKGLADMAVNRPGSSKRSEIYFSGSFSGFSSRSRRQEQEDTTIYTAEELKYQEKFWKLKKINDLKMKQLNGMSKKDPNRAALVNEVNVVKRKMKKFYEKSGLPLHKSKKK